MFYFGDLSYNIICKIDISFLPKYVGSKQTDGQTSDVVTDVVRNTHISLTLSLSVLYSMCILRAHEAEHRKM